MCSARLHKRPTHPPPAGRRASPRQPCVASSSLRERAWQGACVRLGCCWRSWTRILRSTAGVVREGHRQLSHLVARLHACTGPKRTQTGSQCCDAGRAQGQPPPHGTGGQAEDRHRLVLLAQPSPAVRLPRTVQLPPPSIPFGRPCRLRRDKMGVAM